MLLKRLKIVISQCPQICACNFKKWFVLIRFFLLHKFFLPLFPIQNYFLSNSIANWVQWHILNCEWFTFLMWHLHCWRLVWNVKHQSIHMCTTRQMRHMSIEKEHLLYGILIFNEIKSSFFVGISENFIVLESQSATG